MRRGRVLREAILARFPHDESEITIVLLTHRTNHGLRHSVQFRQTYEDGRVFNVPVLHPHVATTIDALREGLEMASSEKHGRKIGAFRP